MASDGVLWSGPHYRAGPGVAGISAAPHHQGEHGSEGDLVAWYQPHVVTSFVKNPIVETRLDETYSSAPYNVDSSNFPRGPEDREYPRNAEYAMQYQTPDANTNAGSNEHTEDAICTPFGQTAHRRYTQSALTQRLQQGASSAGGQPSPPSIPEISVQPPVESIAAMVDANSEHWPWPIYTPPLTPGSSISELVAPQPNSPITQTPSSDSDLATHGQTIFNGNHQYTPPNTPDQYRTGGTHESSDNPSPGIVGNFTPSQTRFLSPVEAHMPPGRPRSPNRLIPPRVSRSRSNSPRSGSPESLMDMPARNDPRPERRHWCDICDRRFVNIGRHKREKHEPSTIQMVDCPEDGCKRKGINGFRRQHNLKMHRRNVHGHPV
ncbi:hypothetical protein BDD12DRAFT_890101 [Trichophaea hybrida]|nr:hypothetical protein BDD12DRAFT_890101 [Trichophaea hybrida]